MDGEPAPPAPVTTVRGRYEDGSRDRGHIVRIQVRRVYEDPEPDGGARVLVDRLWPRGIAKERLDLDHWAKEVAPSTELRTWYGHRPERFDEFRRRYLAELKAPAAA